MDLRRRARGRGRAEVDFAVAYSESEAGTEILGLNGQLHPESADAQLHGRMQWLYRIAPMLAFGGGTNEVQRNTIATRGCGLPRK